MKKYMMAAASLTMLAFVGCTTSPTGTSQTTTGGGSIGTATTVGMNVFKAAVDNQCRTELTANKAWRVVALTMTAEQQQATEDKICGCVSEKAPENLTIVELTQAVTDPTARTKIVANTVAKTLNSCYSEFVK